MKRSLFLLSLSLLFFTACQNSGGNSPVAPASSPESVAVGDYELQPIDNSNCQLAIKKDASGILLESGLLCDGERSGTWTHYGAASQSFPEKLVTYIGGNYNGTYMEMNDRGQIELLATYKNNRLHGPWGKYRFGRPEIEAFYVDGELDGVYREFDFRNGQLKKEVSYKAGKEDGVMRFYDEEGNIVLEYMYRDGVKVDEQITTQSGE